MLLTENDILRFEKMLHISNTNKMHNKFETLKYGVWIICKKYNMRKKKNMNT